MGFNTINFHCNIIPGIKVNGNNFDILHTFNQSETPGYMMFNLPKKLLYQNIRKDRI